MIKYITQNMYEYFTLVPTYEICGYVLSFLGRDAVLGDLGDLVGDQRRPHLPPAVDEERQELHEREEDPLAAQLVLGDQLLAHIGVVSQLRVH